MNENSNRFSDTSTIPAFYFGDEPQTSQWQKSSIEPTLPLFSDATSAREATYQESDMDLWKDFYSSPVTTDEIDGNGDRQFSSDDSLWMELDTTESWQSLPEDDAERIDAQAFIVEATQVLDEAYLPENSANYLIAQATYSLEKAGIAPTEEMQDVSHLARFIAFYLADVDFAEYSLGVEAAFSGRTIEKHEWTSIVERAVARIDSDEQLAKEIYTCLPLFTNDDDERHTAVSVLALTLVEIADWEKTQTAGNDQAAPIATQI